MGLFVLAHKSRSPSTPWIYYFPVALLLFSFVQYQNSLWGFQMAWYLVMLAFAIAVFLLDRPTLSWLVLTGAIGAAVLGSFSSLQGFFIWPIGLMLLLYRRRSKGLVVAWVASAVITGGVYFHKLSVLWAIGPLLCVRTSGSRSGTSSFFLSAPSLVTRPRIPPQIPQSLPLSWDSSSS